MANTLSGRQVAEFLGVSHEAVRAWRMRGRGPAYEKVGGTYRYKLADVQSWLNDLNQDNPHYKFQRTA